MKSAASTCCSNGPRTALLLALLCLAATAQAGPRWSVELGWPVYPSSYSRYATGTVMQVLPIGAVSVTVGGGRYWRHGGLWYRPWGPSFVIVAPPVVIAATTPWVLERQDRMERREAVPDPLFAAPPPRPDPVITPRNGQDAQQTEADRQACNRWATTQPAALAEASVFQRAVEACMDGRGYTMK